METRRACAGTPLRNRTPVRPRCALYVRESSSENRGLTVPFRSTRLINWRLDTTVRLGRTGKRLWLDVMLVKERPARDVLSPFQQAPVEPVEVRTGSTGPLSSASGSMAKSNGIAVRFKNPWKASQCCHADHADFNAARNLRTLAVVWSLWSRRSQKQRHGLAGHGFC